MFALVSNIILCKTKGIVAQHGRNLSAKPDVVDLYFCDQSTNSKNKNYKIKMQEEECLCEQNDIKKAG